MADADGSHWQRLCTKGAAVVECIWGGSAKRRPGRRGGFGILRCVVLDLVDQGHPWTESPASSASPRRPPGGGSRSGSSRTGWSPSPRPGQLPPFALEV